MRAVRFSKIGVSECVLLPEPSPGPGQVILEVEACGLCGTDIHALHGDFPAQFPDVPGHEFVGTVVQTGDGVARDVLDRRAAVHPLKPCGTCDACVAGRINFCRSLHIYGGDLAGGFAERVAVDVRSLRWFPDGLDPEPASLAEPLSCVLHGLGQIGINPRDRVLIFGAGPIGLLMIQACLAMGADEVTSIEPELSKRSLAESLGAVTGTPGDHLPERSFDLVVDASGVPSVVEGAIRFVRDGGRILLFGVCPPGVRVGLEPFEVFRREITISGCFSLTDEMDAALALLASGKVLGQPLISHRLGLADLPEFLLTPESGSGVSIKDRGVASTMTLSKSNKVGSISEGKCCDHSQDGYRWRRHVGTHPCACIHWRPTNAGGRHL